MNRMTIDTADRGVLVRIEEAIRVSSLLGMAGQTGRGFRQVIARSETEDQVWIH